MEYYWAIKNEGNSNTFYNVDEHWRHYVSKINQSQRENAVWFHLYEVFRVVQFIKRKVDDVCQGLGAGEMSCHLAGAEFQFCKVKSYEDWLYNSVNILNVTEPYT